MRCGVSDNLKSRPLKLRFFRDRKGRLSHSPDLKNGSTISRAASLGSVPSIWRWKARRRTSHALKSVPRPPALFSLPRTRISARVGCPWQGRDPPPPGASPSRAFFPLHLDTTSLLRRFPRHAPISLRPENIALRRKSGRVEQIFVSGAL